jgi:hypothetical protein
MKKNCLDAIAKGFARNSRTQMKVKMKALNKPLRTCKKGHQL